MSPNRLLKGNSKLLRASFFSTKNISGAVCSTALALVFSSAAALANEAVNKAAYSYSGGDAVNISGETYKATSGGNDKRAWGVLVSKNSTLNVSDTAVSTFGPRAHGIQVGAKGGNADGADTSVINLDDNVTVLIAGPNSYGLHAIDGGTINGAAAITTAGVNGFGAFAESYSTINLDGGYITTTGNRGHGLIANDDIGQGANGGVISATDVSITTSGEWAFGAYASRGAQITLDGGSITTNGLRGYGILSSTGGTVTSSANIVTHADRAHAVQAGASANERGGTVILEGGTIRTQGVFAVGLHAVFDGVIEGTTQITTTGLGSFGAFAESNSSISLSNSTIITDSDNSYGVLANNDEGTIGGKISLANTDITTKGIHAYGVVAEAGGDIVLEGGSITTANDKGQYNQDGDGSRGYAILAKGIGSTVSADGTSIRTFGQRAYGAYALDGAEINLSNLAIETDGFMAYGVYASGAGSVLTANNVNITTNGNVGDGAWAYQGGRVELDAGTFNIYGTSNPTAGELSNGLVAVGGIAGINNGIINANNINITTYGEDARGFRAGATVGPVDTSGSINLTNSVITSTGVGGIIGNISYGSTVAVTDSVLISEQGAGLLLNESATLTLTRTRVETAQESILSNFETSGQSQTINVEAGSIIAANNGTLLLVKRDVNGGDGVVTLNLESGSTTQGDIIDLDLRTIGGTDVYLNEGAIWSGNIQGVRNFIAAAGSDSTFEGDVTFEQEFVADGFGSSFTFEGEATFKDGFTANSANTVQFSKEPGVQTTIETDLKLSGGSVVAGGSLVTPVLVKQDVLVDEYSLFKGNFQVLGHVNNEGATGPGNSIGTHTYGSVTWGADHVYNVEIDPTGASDLVSVTGTAEIAGTVKVTPLGGFLVGTPYTILKAGNIEGRFNDKVDFAAPTAFLTANLQQGTTDVQLQIERSNVTFASVAKSENQAAVAGSLDKASVNNALVSAIVFNNVDNAVSAFDQLSGEVHASAKAGLIETGALVQNTINNRLRAAFDGVAASSSPLLGYAADGSSAGSTQGHGIAVWGSGFGSWGRFNGTANVASTSTSSGGFVAGLDGALNDAWRLGVVAGYSRSSISTASRSSSTKSDNYHLGIYGGAEWENVGFRAGLNYTWHKLSSNRSVSFANVNDSLSASYSGGTFQAFGELGYKVEVEKVKFEPFANLSYASLRTNSFTETGNATALSVAGNTTSVTFMTLGARAETKLDFAANGARLHGMIGWRHAFGNATPTSTHSLIGANPFVVSGLPIARNSAVVEAGIDLNVSQQAALGISYTGQFGSGSHQNGFNAKFSAKF